MRTCIITGVSGFLGSRLQGHLEACAWRVLPWTRRPSLSSGTPSFRLGENVPLANFQGVDALVHCAYDFNLLSWQDIERVNVKGSENLIRAARMAGVKTIIVISSLSAFPGCRSLYGKAKLAVEQVAAEMNALVIRPGLIYGDHPGGMFGRLVRQVERARFLPRLAGGRQVQYLLHEADLGELVLGMLDGRIPLCPEPISAAHEQGWELKEILRGIGLGLSRRVIFPPVPWWLVWLGLKGLELARVRTPFRSDSVISMVYQNPHPSFELLRKLGICCRPFRLTPAMLEVSSACAT